MQVPTALLEGRAYRGHAPLKDVRLRQVVKAVRLPEGGGVEVEVEGQVSEATGYPVSIL